MPLFAAIEGQIVFLVIAAIIGVVNWIAKKAEGAKPDAPPAPQEEGVAEAERMRKFLEALGVPADQAPKPVRRAVVARPRIAPPPIPRARSLDEMDAPTLPVERLHIPELRTPAVPEFHTVSSQIGAIPFPSAPTGESDAYAAAPRERPDDNLRSLLGSPRDLRSAIMLREILGPPRSLQG